LPAEQAIFRISDFRFPDLKFQISLKDFGFSASFARFHGVRKHFAIVPTATANQLRSWLFPPYAIKKRLAREIRRVTIFLGGSPHQKEISGAFR
jgi:hypothetical protein